MKIAVITGASSGIGKEFLKQLASHGTYDEVWAIARNEERLNALKAETSIPVRPISLDLSKEEGLCAYRALLEKENPNVSLLVNCSGFGKFEATDQIPLSESMNMIDLNCKALLFLTVTTLPYLRSGAEIIEIASVAAFQPLPYINVYAASKAFVLSFSRALHQEEKKKGIEVLAVCPFWTKTAFFDRAVSKKAGEKEPIVKYYAAMYAPEKIVQRAFRDAKRKKQVSQYGFVARLQSAMCKILPHSWIMKIWMNQQKLK